MTGKPIHHRGTERTEAGRNDRHAALTEAIIGAAIEVHRTLGPGLLESAYEACLCHELQLRSIPFASQVPLPVHYKRLEISAGYRLDLVVQEAVIVELKSVAHIDPLHRAQLLTYLRLSGLTVGLLLNFNVPVLSRGIVRMVV